MGGYIYGSCTLSFIYSIFRVFRISVAIISSFVTHTQFSPHVTSSQEYPTLPNLPALPHPTETGVHLMAETKLTIHTPIELLRDFAEVAEASTWSDRRLLDSRAYLCPGFAETIF
jgi:hypothetical protein